MTKLFNFSAAALALAIALPALASDDAVTTMVDDQTNPTGHWSKLPIWGDKARERGYDLPIPVGVTFFATDINAPYKADSDFKLGATGGWLAQATEESGFAYIPAEDVTIDGNDQSIQLKIDAWVLPFWNVYALVGQTRGSKDITADLSNAQGIDCSKVTNLGDKLVCATLTSGEIPILLPIPIEYKATSWGLGSVLAGQVPLPNGLNPILLSAVGSYVQAKTNTTDSIIKTTIAQFRVGQRYDINGDWLYWFLSYQYQNISQNITGSYNFAGTPLESIAEVIDFDVDLTRDQPHNMGVSLMYEFGGNNQYNLFVDYAFATSEQVTVGLGWRF